MNGGTCAASDFRLSNSFGVSSRRSCATLPSLSRESSFHSIVPWGVLISTRVLSWAWASHSPSSRYPWLLRNPARHWTTLRVLACQHQSPSLPCLASTGRLGCYNRATQNSRVPPKPSTRLSILVGTWVTPPSEACCGGSPRRPSTAEITPLHYDQSTGGSWWPSTAW